MDYCIGVLAVGKGAAYVKFIEVLMTNFLIRREREMQGDAIFGTHC